MIKHSLHLPATVTVSQNQPEIKVRYVDGEGMTMHDKAY